MSVATEEAYNRAKDSNELDLSAVARFIEVKGRSERTATIELEPNQRECGTVKGSVLHLSCLPRPEEVRIYAVGDPGRSRWLEG